MADLEDDPLGAPTEPRTQRGARLALVVMWPGGMAERSLAKDGTWVLGRAPDSTIVVDHASISRRHVAIHVAGGGVHLEDMGSMNGTVVDGAHLEPGQRAALTEGGIAQVGDAVVCVRRISASPVRSPAGPVVTGARIVADEAMMHLYRMVELVAKSHVNVLVRGETGAGKEVIAEAVHRASSRAARPFLGINCAALSESLLETELFGHERGAFTGAVSAKPGLLEAANGGTAFLDEVAEMPLSAQAKLLRVLEKREVMRVGSVKVITIDVRFVAATHRDLRTLVSEGRFREDLFFRLDGITLEVPPLRERPKEIVALSARFLDEACRAAGRRSATLTGPALERLVGHAWPGNVRELRNVIERAVLLSSGDRIDAQHVLTGALSPQLTGAPPPPVPPRAAAAPSSSRPLAEEIAELERHRIIQALDAAAGNQTEAARLLGLPRRTLIARIEQYGIPRPRKK